MEEEGGQEQEEPPRIMEGHPKQGTQVSQGIDTRIISLKLLFRKVVKDQDLL